MPVPRRLVDEIVASHALEPALVDVYVEGAFDEDILRWYFSNRGRREPQVYRIDTVEVDPMQIANLTDGNRQRVIALGVALSGQIPDGKVSCVCDRDFEPWLPTLENLPSSVLLTDFASMDSYAIDAGAVNKFLSVIVGGSEVTAESLLGELGPPLRECFAIRLGHALLRWELSWISPERCCTVAKSGTVSFDRNDFVNRLLIKNGHRKQIQQLDAAITKLRTGLGDDLRSHANGHDLGALVSWYLKKRNHPSVPAPEQIVRTLFGCLDLRKLVRMPLYSELERRCDKFRQCAKTKPL